MVVRPRNWVVDKAPTCVASSAAKLVAVKLPIWVELKAVSCVELNSLMSVSLRPRRIVVLSPAYQFLYSEFDRAIGHFRRYTAGQLQAITPPGAKVDASFYLDSVGMMASAANKLLLKQKMPGRGQVLTWDRLMVPLSRFIDPLVGRSFGRSVIVVWVKDPAA